MYDKSCIGLEPQTTLIHIGDLVTHPDRVGQQKVTAVSTTIFHQGKHQYFIDFDNFRVINHNCTLTLPSENRPDLFLDDIVMNGSIVGHIISLYQKENELMSAIWEYHLEDMAGHSARIAQERKKIEDTVRATHRDDPILSAEENQLELEYKLKDAYLESLAYKQFMEFAKQHEPVIHTDILYNSLELLEKHPGNLMWKGL